MTSPATHSKPINAENEMQLQVINRISERQKTAARQLACTGYLFSINILAIKGKKSLRNGACFQIGFFPAPLLSIVKYFYLCEAITFSARSGSYFPFSDGLLYRCLYCICIRYITVFCPVFKRD